MLCRTPNCWPPPSYPPISGHDIGQDRVYGKAPSLSGGEVLRKKWENGKIEVHSGPSQGAYGAGMLEMLEVAGSGRGQIAGIPGTRLTETVGNSALNVSVARWA